MQIRYLFYRFIHSYCMYLISRYLKQIRVVMESTDDLDCRGHLYMEETQVCSLERILNAFAVWTVSFSVFNLEFHKYKKTLIFNQKHLLLIPYNGKVALRGLRLGKLISLIYGRGLASLGELYRWSLALVRPCLRLFPIRAHVPCFHISYYSLTIIHVSASFSCFILAVPMREVLCVGYTRAWDPRFL